MAIYEITQHSIVALAETDFETDSAATNILNFLGWADATGGTFGQDVRIVLASADFSQEITSTVLWLVDRGVDIACVRMPPHTLEGRVLIDGGLTATLPIATVVAGGVADPVPSTA